MDGKNALFTSHLTAQRLKSCTKRLKLLRNIGVAECSSFSISSCCPKAGVEIIDKHSDVLGSFRQRVSTFTSYFLVHLTAAQAAGNGHLPPDNSPRTTSPGQQPPGQQQPRTRTIPPPHIYTYGGVPWM